MLSRECYEGKRPKGNVQIQTLLQYGHFTALDAKKRRRNVTQGLLASRILSTILLYERAV